MTIFLLLFVGIQFLLHLYIFSRFAHFFDFHKGIWFYVVLGVLSVSFVFANILERTLDGNIGRFAYILATTWLGVIFLLFFIVLIFDGINFFAKLPALWVGISALFVGVILIAYSFVNGGKLVEKEVTVPIEGIEKDILAVHLSDIHLGAVQNKAYAEAIVKRVNNINPDVIFLTGDLADGSGDFSESTIAPFNGIKAPIYYVTGNHENYLGIEQVLSVVNKTKIKPLRNELVEFKGMQIAGFDYPFEVSGVNLKDNLKRLNISKDKPLILLYHAPQELADAKEAGVDLMLAGHVHGGQIFPFNFFVRLVFPYTRGLQDYKGMAVHVSTGTGTWGPRMRLGSNNQIVKLNLKSKRG
jgi:hypothetical protein